MKPGTLRDYTCECSDPKCRERIYLSIGGYTRLAKQGRVVARRHVDGPVLHVARDAAVVV